MGAVRRGTHLFLFVYVILNISVTQGAEVEGLRVVRRPGRRLLQCTTEAACRARCPAGNNIIYLAPQDGTSGQCVCICSPTNTQQNSTPSTRTSSGLIGGSSFAQPLSGGGVGGSGGGAGVASGGQSGAGGTNPDSGSADSSTAASTQSSGSGSVVGTVNSASQQSSSSNNLVGTVQSSGSSGSASETTTAALVNSATSGSSAGSGGSSTSRSSRAPPQSG